MQGKSLTDVDQIVYRLNTRDRLRYFKRKVHDLRKITAGDFSKIDDNTPPAISPDNFGQSTRVTMEGLYEILVMDYKEGNSNLILQAVRTLAMQTGYQFPDISFADVTSQEATVNQLYLNARLGTRPRGCDAAHHMLLSLFDYLIGGIGWAWAGTDDGKPIIRHVDTLDCYWDLDAKLITDIRWVAACVREPLYVWIEEFGPEHFDDALDASALEHPYELVFYFDVDGPGTAAVFKFDGEALDPEPIEIRKNPHVYDYDGKALPFLPIEPMYHLQLPSVKFPMSLVETMLAPQIAYRGIEDYLRQIIHTGAGFYEVVEGSINEDQVEELKNGEIGAIVWRKSDGAPITVKQPLEIPMTALKWRDINMQQIVANSGANPYASGNKVDGIAYASEVNAIQASAGLMASTIGKDHSGHWSRMVAKCLANGAKHDRSHLVLDYDGVRLEFGPSDRIGRYLRPDSTPSISEDSMRFESRDQAIARAAQLLQISALPAVAMQFPAAIGQAFERYLEASGVKDVAGWLKRPDPQPQPMGAPGMAVPGQGAPMAAPMGPTQDGQVATSSPVAV